LKDYWHKWNPCAFVIDQNGKSYGNSRHYRSSPE